MGALDSHISSTLPCVSELTPAQLIMISNPFLFIVSEIYCTDFTIASRLESSRGIKTAFSDPFRLLLRGQDYTVGLLPLNP